MAYESYTKKSYTKPYSDPYTSKYNHAKLRELLSKAYIDRYGKQPSQAADRVIECLDDVCMDEWRKDVQEMDSQIRAAAEAVQRDALKVLADLQGEIESFSENGVQDARVVDALKAYKTIVGMEFDTPQQRLQNIQNASYFIWALYAKESSSVNMLLKNLATDVAKEDNRDNVFSGLTLN